jgi:hypothetical protein
LRWRVKLEGLAGKYPSVQVDEKGKGGRGKEKKKHGKPNADGESETCSQSLRSKRVLGR